MRPSLPPEGPFKPGDRLLEKYEVRALLGQGGHAFVYDCYDSFLAQEVAIKVIPNPPHRGPELVRRAREEARVLFRLNHPNVVSVTNAGELGDGMVYIVMEKLDGSPLRAVLERLGRLSVPEALHIAWQIAEGVAAAHGLNVIHRDLKPENAFVLANNRVKVLDFGIAKFLGYGVETTQKHLFHGTLLYMSPEHLQGFGVTFRSDVYALGTILYEMLAGRNPCLIGVEAPTVQQLAWIQIAQLPPPLDKVVRGVPDDVVRMVKRATAKQAAQRHASMHDFSAAIHASLERCLTGARYELRDVLASRENLALPLRVPTFSSTEPYGPNSYPESDRSSARTPDAAPLLAQSAAAPAAEDVGLLTAEHAANGALRLAADPKQEVAASWLAATRTTSATVRGIREHGSLSVRMIVGAIVVGVAAAVPIGVLVGGSRPPGNAGPSTGSALPASAAGATSVQEPSTPVRLPALGGSQRPVVAGALASTRSTPDSVLPARAQPAATPSREGAAVSAKPADVPARAAPVPSGPDTRRVRERAVVFDEDTRHAR